jgi:hypothetical protein
MDRKQEHSDILLLVQLDIQCVVVEVVGRKIHMCTCWTWDLKMMLLPVIAVALRTLHQILVLLLVFDHISLPFFTRFSVLYVDSYWNS